MFSYLNTHEQKSATPAVNPVGLAGVIPSNRNRLSNEQKLALNQLRYAVPGLYTRTTPDSAFTRRQKDRRKNQIKTSKEREFAKTWNAAAESMPSRPISGPKNPVFRTTQEYVTTLTSLSNTVPTFGALNFQFSSIPQAADLSNVFDQYRIDMVEVWITPLGQSAATGTSRTASVIDYDDSTVLTTFNQALNYPSCVSTLLNNGHYRRFKPHVAVAVYASSAFTSFSNESDVWIDMVSQNVEHYGIKWAAETAASNNTVDVLVRLHVSMRQVR